jgi:hypothetical protein
VAVSCGLHTPTINLIGTVDTADHTAVTGIERARTA